MSVFIVSVLSIFIILQVCQGIKCAAISPTETGGERLTVTPFISTVSTIPRAAAVSANTDIITNTRPGNVVSSLATSDGSGASVTSDHVPTSNTVGNSGINVLRRGAEFLADQIAAALGGVTSLVNILENTSQTGELNANNLGTSIEALSGRLLNYGYDVARNLLQELTNQVSTIPSTAAAGVAFRPSQLSLSGLLGGGTINSGSRTVQLGRRQQVQPQNRFGLITDFRNENFSVSGDDAVNVFDFGNNDSGLFLSRMGSISEEVGNAADAYSDIGETGGRGMFDSLGGNFGNEGNDFSIFYRTGGRLGSLIESFGGRIGNVGDNIPGVDNGGAQILSQAASISRGNRLNSLIGTMVSPFVNTSASNSEDDTGTGKPFVSPSASSPESKIPATTDSTLPST